MKGNTLFWPNSTMPWIINVHREAAKQLSAIPPDRRERILNDIDELVEDPLRGLVKPLKGKAHTGHYRKRCRAATASYSSPSMRRTRWKCSRFFCATNAPISKGTCRRYAS